MRKDGSVSDSVNIRLLSEVSRLSQAGKIVVRVV